MKKQLKVFVPRPRLVNRNHIARKVLARCMKHEKLACGRNGERLNAKSDQKHSASTGVLQQPFEELGFVEWRSASQLAASC
jgi:hypothetical protein